MQNRQAKIVNLNQSLYICNTFHLKTMDISNLRLTIVSLLAATGIIAAQAQARRIVAHTTQQSLAMTDIREMQQTFSAEIIEAYEYEMVDEPPMFPGGNNALVQYINSSRRYPAQAYKNKIHGRVLCSFIVQPDGEITHVNVLRGVEPSLDREAVRILGSMPNWHARRINGNKVAVYCILPVTFRL